MEIIALHVSHMIRTLFSRILIMSEIMIILEKNCGLFSHYKHAIE